MSIKYDPAQAEDIFRTNALVGIPEEVTALAVARRYQKEAEWNTALSEWKKGIGYRQNGKSLVDLLNEVCTPKPAELALYNGIPQVHDYDEKHLLVEGISSVDADGKVVGSYDKLLVMKDVFRHENGGIKFFTPYQAIKHCEQEGYFLPPSNLTVPMVAALFQHRNIPEANKVLMRYKDKGNGNGWHAQNTVLAYKNPEQIHYPVDADFPKHGGTENINASQARIELPFKKEKGIWPFNKKLEDIQLEDGLNHPLVSTFVKQFTGLADPSVLIEIGKYFQKPTIVWFPKNPVKVEDCNGTRAAWFGCSSNNLNLDGDDDLYSNSAARGVRGI